MFEASSTARAPVQPPGPSFGSREVSWWPVHEFVSALVAQVNTTLPIAGTPSWCALADGDPRKLLAVALAGEHQVLRVELEQAARVEASKAVAAAADWGRISHRTVAGRGRNYIPRRVS